MKAIFFHLLLLYPVFDIHAQENSGNSKDATSKILKDTLDKAAKELKEVHVTATRPLVDVQSDRVIVDPLKMPGFPLCTTFFPSPCLSHL